eukprot:TRINITY_DN679_c0_g1_i6.p1 TRINITY_DN679_c0_g1~~TRINITY_DN679_c0_g1_i6.p1  ORF type:complete len:3274 (-),score=593.17 TRINITY_DN679_c0_g1_i6:142-9879(-)
MQSLDDCKTKCVETNGCQGIEYNENATRCEVWTRSEGIQASIALSGYMCLRFVAEESSDNTLPSGWAPVDGGEGRACRGAHPSDNSQNYFEAHAGVASLNGCLNLCMETTGCVGVEYNEGAKRCEVWTRAEGIQASVNASGYLCLAFETDSTTSTTTKQYLIWQPVDGGDGRACRGQDGGDNDASYFTVIAGVPTLEDCKAKCVERSGCQGLEYNEGAKRCEVWTRAEGIQASIALSGYTCLRLVKTQIANSVLGRNALLVQPGSSLFEEFCQGSIESCIFPAKVVLKKRVPCFGADCEAEHVKTLVVGNHTYDHVPPACVDIYFQDGADIEVDPDGSVRGVVGGQDKFKVHWYGSHPVGCPEMCNVSSTACVCTASVKTWPVFSRVPDEVSLQQKLKIGSFKPVLPCSANCDGAVKVFSFGSEIDEHTIFEFDGKFFKNAEVIVDVGGSTFRNPPNFMPRTGNQRSRSKAALDEVESVLDSVFHHPNTAVFIGYRLIQRLVTSNPSPAYVQAVGDAFKSGEYNGTKYGEYGSLAATVAAVLLHPEARNEGSTWTGKLREPFLKFVHFMRSTEFEEKPGRMIIMKNTEGLIGQFPYHSPTVFNFYMPDYALDTDYHPEDFSATLVAPEFQIFDTPYIVSFTEAVLGMVQDQGLSSCSKGFGIDTWSCDGTLKRASFNGSTAEIWEELDLLLTGGRLGSFKETLMGEFSYDASWTTLFEMGTTLRPTQHNEETFNRLVEQAGSGIIRRECFDCRVSHQDIYIRVPNPKGWNAYQDLLVTWQSHGFQRRFQIYSTLEDAKLGFNEWKYCNGGYTGIGFPRDCGPDGYVRNQWTSFTRRGRKKYRYSVLKGTGDMPATPGMWTDLGPGCCKHSGTHALHNRWHGSNLEDCKKKCLEFDDCAFIQYGWSNSNWCTVLSRSANCSSGSLMTGDKDCGSSGSNGVHTYQYQSHCWESHTKYEPLDMPGYGRTGENSATACQKRCARVSGCAHFSYWHGDGGCHLQDASAIASAVPHDEKATAGPSTCDWSSWQKCSMTASSSGSSPGSVLQVFAASSLSECHAACLAADACLADMFNTSSGDCFLLGRMLDANLAASSAALVSNKRCVQDGEMTIDKCLVQNAYDQVTSIQSMSPAARRDLLITELAKYGLDDLQQKTDAELANLCPDLSTKKTTRSDYLIVGGGPGGIGCAIKLKKLFPASSITILEHGDNTLSDFKSRGYTDVQSWLRSGSDPDFYYLANTTDGYQIKLGKGLGGGTLHFGLQFIDQPEVIAKGYADWSEDFKEVANIVGAEAFSYDFAAELPNKAWSSLRDALENVSTLQVYNNKVYSDNLAESHRVLIGELLSDSVNVKYGVTVKHVIFGGNFTQEGISVTSSVPAPMDADTAYGLLFDGHGATHLAFTGTSGKLYLDLGEVRSVSQIRFTADGDEANAKSLRFFCTDVGPDTDAGAVLYTSFNTAGVGPTTSPMFNAAHRYCILEWLNNHGHPGSTRLPELEIFVSDGRAIGVESFEGERFEANVVVVSSGAIQSPAILQRSGISAGSGLMSHAAITETYLPPNTTFRTIHLASDNLSDIAYDLPVVKEMSGLNTDPNHLFAFFTHAPLSLTQVEDAKRGVFDEDSSNVLFGDGFRYVYDLGNFFSGSHPGGNKYNVFQENGWDGNAVLLEHHGLDNALGRIIKRAGGKLYGVFDSEATPTMVPVPDPQWSYFNNGVGVGHLQTRDLELKHQTYFSSLPGLPYLAVTFAQATEANREGRVIVRDMDSPAAPEVTLNLLGDAGSEFRMSTLKSLQQAFDENHAALQKLGFSRTSRAPVDASYIQEHAYDIFHYMGSAVEALEDECRVAGKHGLYVSDASVLPQPWGGSTSVPTMVAGYRCGSIIASDLPTLPAFESASSVPVAAVMEEQDNTCGIYDPPEHTRTYSSVWDDEEPGRHHARSSLQSRSAWVSGIERVGEWMQIDLGSVKHVKGTVTKGRADWNQWVTKYTVQHSRDGVAWVNVDGTIEGSTDRNTEVVTTFPGPVQARFVRFTVQAWKSHISMRAAVITCTAVPALMKHWVNSSRNDFDGEVGFRFQAKAPLSVSYLGRALPSRGALQSTVAVTLWSEETKAVLGTVSVGSSSSVEEGYAWEMLSKRVQLTTGSYYRITQSCSKGMRDRWHNLAPSDLEEATLPLVSYQEGVVGSTVGVYPDSKSEIGRWPVVNLKVTTGSEGSWKATLSGTSYTHDWATGRGPLSAAGVASFHGFSDEVFAITANGSCGEGVSQLHLTGSRSGSVVNLGCGNQGVTMHNFAFTEFPSDGSFFVADPSKHGMKCRDEASNRVFDLRGDSATAKSCMQKCMSTENCIAYSGIFGSWCIGCRVPVDATHPEAVAYKLQRMHMLERSARIPGGWRLCSKSEVENDMMAVQGTMGEWTIAQLADEWAVEGRGHGANIVKKDATQLAVQLICAQISCMNYTCPMGYASAPERLSSTAVTLDSCCHALSYEMRPVGDATCPAGFEHVESKSECEFAVKSLGFEVGTWRGYDTNIPVACSLRVEGTGTGRYADYSTQTHWNTAGNGTARGDLSPICRRKTAPLPLLQIEERSKGFVELRGVCADPNGGNLNEGEVNAGSMDRDSCERRCQYQTRCTAYQFNSDSESNAACYLHTSSQVAGGTGTFGARCFIKQHSSSDCFPPKENFLARVKACPGDLSTCLSSNVSNTLAEAWHLCSQVQACGAIIKSPDGKFLLRRATDPDIDASAGWGTMTWTGCHGNLNVAESCNLRACGPGQILKKNFTSMKCASSRCSVLLDQDTCCEPVQEDGLENIRDAENAILMSPQFHTLGSVQPIGVRQPPPPSNNTASNGSEAYKAMVVLYLFGGADTYNMLVPQDCELYEQYMSIRKDVALMPDQLLKINTTGQACAHFGIHSELPILKELYDLKEAAFVTNVGNLVEPTLGVRNARTCPGNFGHSGMQHASQTLMCQYGMDLLHGGGGRMADALARGSVLETGLTTSSFSLAGKAPWSQGISTERKVISGNEVSEGGFKPGRKVQRVIDKLTTIEFSTVYAKEFVNQFDAALNSYQAVAESLQAGDDLLENPQADYGGMNELKQVARLIASRNVRKSDRDFFFLGFGGFDMHTNLAPSLANRFRTMNTGITAFVNEMKAQGVWENVVFATQSDFARTLDPNANKGTDHGWAGNHFVLSGAVEGGRVYNDFHASLAAGNRADVGRGRLIPEYPYESYMVPIAKWLGIQSSSQLDKAFPNLRNFNNSHLISDLF